MLCLRKSADQAATMWVLCKWTFRGRVLQLSRSAPAQSLLRHDQGRHNRAAQHT